MYGMCVELKVKFSIETLHSFVHAEQQ